MSDFALSTIISVEMGVRNAFPNSKSSFPKNKYYFQATVGLQMYLSVCKENLQVFNTEFENVNKL